MLIGFTHKTSKVLPRIFCRRFRHCAVVIRNQESGIRNQYIMLQFVRPNKIVPINLSARDIKILQQHGWVFIMDDGRWMMDDVDFSSSLTCVSFAKKYLGIKNIFIQTPDQLYKELITSF